MKQINQSSKLNSKLMKQKILFKKTLKT